ncbi:MAG: ribosome-associated translation inhibitor RaiA [Thermodesulfobacteriota bacterium]
MQVTFTFRHIGSSDAIKEYAEEKTERIRKYLADPIEVHWVLSVEKIRHIAEVTVVAKNLTVKAQEETQEMYSAIDKVIDKIEKQVRKHKEKVKGHKGAGARGGEPEGALEEGPPRIVKTENVFLKPMSVEEATMQMEVVKKDFLVFTDAATSNVNVLYRRGDGGLGLIETRVR